jgi:hypothetical protein
MDANRIDEYMRDWPTTTCAECGESCLGCEGVIKLGEKRDDMDTRKVIHSECYKKWMPTFAEFKHHVAMICMLCRQPCDGSEDVKQLALRHAMHGECYRKWLVEQDADQMLRQARRGSDLPTVVLPGEEEKSREQVAQRRNAILFGGRGKRSLDIELRRIGELSERPPTGPCNDGAPANAEGEDSRQDVA